MNDGASDGGTFCEKKPSSKKCKTALLYNPLAAQMRYDCLALAKERKECIKNSVETVDTVFIHKSALQMFLSHALPYYTA